MNLNHKGFTIIELVIVVSLLAVALTIFILSFNTVFALDVKHCANEMYSLLQENKMAALSKQAGQNYVHIYRKSDGVYMDCVENGAVVSNSQSNETNFSGNKIGKTNVTVTYKTEDGTTGTLGTNGIYLAFNKGDGSFLDIGSTNKLRDGTQPANSHYYTQVSISNQFRTITITLEHATGRFSLGG